VFITIFLIQETLCDDWKSATDPDNPRVVLKWKLMGKKINLQLRIDSTVEPEVNIRYIALGWNPDADGAMNNADMAISVEEGVIQDYFSEGFEPPSEDLSNDIEYNYAGVIDGVCIMDFTRSLDTGDDRDNVIKAKGQNTFIWAFGDDTDGLEYHGRKNRGIIRTAL